MSYHAPSHKRIDVNRTDSEAAEVTNTLDENVSENGLLTYNICGDDFGEQYCIGAGAGASQEPHNKNGGLAVLGLSQLEMAWNSADDWYRNDLPSFMQDFTQFKTIQFRAAVNFDTSPLDLALNFRIELTDADGETSSLAVADYTEALYFPPGDYGTTLPRTMHNTIAVPVEDFAGIDLTTIQYIRFVFNESPTGAILISDLTLNSDEELVFPPIAAFEANVTETCTGVINFADNSTFSPTAWFWEFGDGETSTEENPVHTYLSNGTYTVTLTVTNDAGSDEAVITSYIVVDRPDAPIGTDVSICGATDVTVSAVGSGGGTLNWYDAEVGGTLLGTGTDYTSFVDVTTSFFVEEVVASELLSVGPPDNTFGAGGNFGANDLRGLFFDAYAPFTLVSVRVYATGAGARNIQILDGDGGAVIHSVTVTIPDGESVVTLNLPIDVYSGYYMKITGALVNLFRINDGSPTYPYEIPGIVALTGSNVAGSELDFYYYFFDWKIREADCISSRALVNVTVEPSFDVVISDDVTIASGETTTLVASGGVTYSWSPTTGLSDPTSATTNASPTVTTTYTVSVEDGEGCIVTEEVTVTVDGQVGLGSNVTNDAFEIYPNPSTGLIYIHAPETTTSYVLEVFAVDGKRVLISQYDSRNGGMTIDLNRVAKGIYYVKLTNGDLEFQEKIVIQ